MPPWSYEVKASYTLCYSFTSFVYTCKRLWWIIIVGYEWYNKKALQNYLRALTHVTRSIVSLYYTGSTTLYVVVAVYLYYYQQDQQRRLLYCGLQVGSQTINFARVFTQTRIKDLVMKLKGDVLWVWILHMLLVKQLALTMHKVLTCTKNACNYGNLPSRAISISSSLHLVGMVVPVLRENWGTEWWGINIVDIYLMTADKI